MKKRGLLLGILLLMISPGEEFSSGGASEKYQLSFRDKIFSLYFNDNHRGWAVGDMGLILNTTDGSETWVKIDSGSDNSLNDVTFIGHCGWIVGENGLILHTVNGGQRWEEQASKAEASLFQVFFLDKQRGVTVGERGTVLWTEDGGSLWQPSPLDWDQIIPESLLKKGIFTLNLYDVFFADEAHGWIVGDSGIVLFSFDGGKNWNLLRIGLFPPLYSVYFKTDLEGWATGSGGLLLHTQDGGKNWAELNPVTRANLFKIRISGDYGVVVGDLGTVLLTANGGRSWDLVETELKPPLPWFLDADIIRPNSPGEAICGGQGIIKRYPLKKQEEKQ